MGIPTKATRRKPAVVTAVADEEGSNRAAKRARAQNKDHLALQFPLKALNEAQRQVIYAFKQNLNVFAYGSAGTGKTYLACALALEKLFNGSSEKIVIIRSTVAVRDQGFLPGTVDEKSEPFKAPYRQIINELCGNGTAYDVLTKKGMIEFITTSFVRGITLDNATVIVDELQNFNWEEATSVLTRMGKNTQMFVIGDGKQNDLQYKKNDKSCIQDFARVAERMSDVFDTITFTHADIVRSDFVKKFIIACDDLGL